MNLVQLLPFGPANAETLFELRAGIERELPVACEILPPEPEPAFAFNLTRQQYSSTEILAAMLKRKTPAKWRLLGVTAVDLYIPILTFVFGEAQLPGTCAVVSSHRLSQEFYGLPADPRLQHERLLKEAVHELGHTLNLSHCEDYQCAMAPSHGVEWIDLKTSRFCGICRTLVPARGILNAFR